MIRFFESRLIYARAATATKASKAQALPKFWVTVNTISTRGADYAHHSTMGLVWLKFAVAPLKVRSTDFTVKNYIGHFRTGFKVRKNSRCPARCALMMFRNQNRIQNLCCNGIIFIVWKLDSRTVLTKKLRIWRDIFFVGLRITDWIKGQIISEENWGVLNFPKKINIYIIFSISALAKYPLKWVESKK